MRGIKSFFKTLLPVTMASKVTHKPINTNDKKLDKMLSRLPIVAEASLPSKIMSSAKLFFNEKSSDSFYPRSDFETIFLALFSTPRKIFLLSFLSFMILSAFLMGINALNQELGLDAHLITNLVGLDSGLGIPMYNEAFDTNESSFADRITRVINGDFVIFN